MLERGDREVCLGRPLAAEEDTHARGRFMLLFVNQVYSGLGLRKGYRGMVWGVRIAVIVYSTAIIDNHMTSNFNIT